MTAQPEHRGGGMPFESDIKDSAAFAKAQADTLEAIAGMKRAVGTMRDTVNGLPIRGRYATEWLRAVAAFNQVAEAANKNADTLATKVATHGKNTDMAYDAGEQAFQSHTNAAQAG